MIVRPTVFVLGAGASHSYGFPLGSELARQVCVGMPRWLQDGNKMHSPDLWSEIVGVFSQVEGIQAELALEMAERYRDAGCESLDEFVETDGNRRFLPIVKASIICILTSYEDEAGLYPDAYGGTAQPKEDWMAYLFRHMRTDAVESFKQNHVKVITFNFDRSFERKLFRMLKAAYAVSEEMATALRNEIPVLYVHGRLGAERWCQPQSEEEPPNRGYVTRASARNKLALMQDVRIVHEDVSSDVLAQAHAWLSDAHTICFLGFGFHQLTLSRLAVRQISQRVRVIGTALGLSTPERNRKLRLFGNRDIPVELYDMTCYDLLRETDVLQTE